MKAVFFVISSLCHEFIKDREGRREGVEGGALFAVFPFPLFSLRLVILSD